jgi:2-polyprenyl-3-methyl-5-hydroxy-6-metoxy-1,4-benzoquinol methylase
LLDIGCGNGALTFTAEKFGYISTGISWDELNHRRSQERAKILGAYNANFICFDVRNLDKFIEMKNNYDFILNFENIEHIIDDKKLMIDISNCLKPGGRLLLTTPNYNFYPISSSDIGLLSKIEDGNHVRRGYSRQMLVELCEIAGLKIEEITYCSGFYSQKTTAILRKLSSINYLFAWLIILPLRIIAPLLDKIIPSQKYSICLEAYKPRF